MRPGQNTRLRGRNNNHGRKGPNPLTRSFESNGPDVKIRGTAQHIAEKYLQLARDAQTSGDPVMAENYLQHAEHYYRIIEAINEATAAEQQQQQARYTQPQAENRYYQNQQQPESQPFSGQPQGQPQQQQPPASTNPFFTPEEEEQDGGDNQTIAIAGTR